MNKKLIALAVAGACVAPAAMAQTANPVTLYGRIYVTLESVEGNSGAVPVPRRTRVEDQSSYLGVRGTEDLGGGLKAFFQLETGFRPDSNTTTFAARNSGVGLQGGWGSVLLGRWDTPWKVVTIAVDPFGDLLQGGITGTLSDQGNFDRREQNNIQYWSPSWGGFALRAYYAANEGKAAGSADGKTPPINPYSDGISVTYTGGPAYLFAVYEEHHDQLNAVNGTSAAAVAGGLEKGWAGGGSFVFGPAKIGGQYQEIKHDTPTGAVSRSKMKNWMGNVTLTFGNNQFIYQYMNSKDGGLSTAAMQPDCDSNSLGWQYNFTKRTWLITSYTMVKNNDAAACNFGANRLAIAAGQDPQGVSLGIRHVF
jgi:predicted porin